MNKLLLRLCVAVVVALVVAVRKSVLFLVLVIAKVSYFFISQEKFIFLHFLEKIELVSKNAVFFFRHRKKKQPFEIESVSAFQTFPGKKKWKKKKQNQNLKNGKLVP